jgi:hypothetical protein
MSDNELLKKRKRARPAPSPDALSYTIGDASAMTGFGRTALYEFMKTGRLEYTEIGGRRKINGDSLRQLVGAA